MQTRILLFLLILSGVGNSLSAQTTGRIETRTRLVAQFTDLQQQWLDAIERKDSAALDRWLSDDFEVWTPNHRGPIPREDWQARAFAKGVRSYRIQNMAVKGLGDGVAVESFELEQTVAPAGVESDERYFVVNVWTSEKNGWRCSDSYVSPITASPASDAVSAKPSGKQ